MASIKKYFLVLFCVFCTFSSSSHAGIFKWFERFRSAAKNMASKAYSHLSHTDQRRIQNVTFPSQQNSRSTSYERLRFLGGLGGLTTGLGFVLYNENTENRRTLPPTDQRERVIDLPSSSISAPETNPLLSAELDFDKDSDECLEWTKAHQVCCSGSDSYDHAETIRQNIDYISDQEFVSAMEETLDDFEKYSTSNPDKKFILVIDYNGKSSSWLADRFKEKLVHLIGQNRLEIVESGFVSYYIEKHENESFDFIRLDDAIYSGLQMSTKVRNTARGQHKFHVIVPYVTSVGKEKVEQAGGIVYFRKIMNRIKEFSKFDSSSRAETTVTFFQHTVGDQMSFDSYLNLGEVSCIKGRKKFDWCHHLSYSCIPFIDKPYSSDITPKDMNLKRKCQSQNNLRFDYYSQINSKWSQFTCDDIIDARNLVKQAIME